MLVGRKVEHEVGKERPRVRRVQSADWGRLGDLAKRGLVAPPRAKLDVGAFLARNMAKPRRGASVVEALLREREARRRGPGPLALVTSDERLREAALKEGFVLE